MFAIEVRADPTDQRFFQTVGQANIYLNGSLRYKGEPTRSYESDVVDLDGKRIIRCHSFSANWWSALFGNRTYIFEAEGGPELARIICQGPFGLDRHISIDGEISPYPSGSEIVLPGAAFSVCGNPIEVRVNASDDSHKLAYIGIAVHLWMRQWASRGDE